MRIGVEETVNEDLVEVRLYQLIGQPLGVDVNERNRIQPRNLRPLHVLHRQDALTDVALDRCRYEDAGELGKVLFEQPKMARLYFVVELVHQRLSEFPNHRREFVPSADLRVLVDEGGDLIEHDQVGEYLFDDPWPLHLDSHIAASTEPCVMHLPE